MKKLALAVCVAAMASTAFAQEARPTVGVGISVIPLPTPGVTPTVQLYVPIRIAPQFRLEPSIGVFTDDQPTGSALPDTRDLTLGVGFFALQRVAAPVDTYVGGRLALNFARTANSAGGNSDSGADVVLAAAVGGEYYLAPRFSLGLEGQLGFFSNSSVRGDDSGLFTTGLAFLRVYFQ